LKLTEKKKRLLRTLLSNAGEYLFFTKTKEGDDDGTNGPSWKYRRKLIYGGYRLGVAMVVFGAITYWSDTGVGAQLVIGGVALISIILTSYTAAATFEDVNIWKAAEAKAQAEYTNADTKIMTTEDE
jgi:hypothetical protein